MLFELVTIDLDYMTDRQEQFDLKISKHLHLGCPWGKIKQKREKNKEKNVQLGILCFQNDLFRLYKKLQFNTDHFWSFKSINCTFALFFIYYRVFWHFFKCNIVKCKKKKKCIAGLIAYHEKSFLLFFPWFYYKMTKAVMKWYITCLVKLKMLNKNAPLLFTFL